MYVKIVIILVVFVVLYVVLVFFVWVWWQVFLLILLLGIVMVGVGFNIMYDGGYQVYLWYCWVNKLMVFMFDLVGGSFYIWQWKYVCYYYIYVNIVQYDSDIDLGVFG